MSARYRLRILLASLESGEGWEIFVRRSNSSAVSTTQPHFAQRNKLASRSQASSDSLNLAALEDAEIVRLNSLLTQKDDEIRATKQELEAAEADHREKDQLVKERDKALKSYQLLRGLTFD